MNDELKKLAAEELKDEAIGYMADVLDLHDFDAEREGDAIIVNAEDGRRIVFRATIEEGEMVK